jgi:hypothetical protein
MTEFHTKMTPTCGLLSAKLSDPRRRGAGAVCVTRAFSTSTCRLRFPTFASVKLEWFPRRGLESFRPHSRLPISLPAPDLFLLACVCWTELSLASQPPNSAVGKNLLPRLFEQRGKMEYDILTLDEQCHTSLQCPVST